MVDLLCQVERCKLTGDARVAVHGRFLEADCTTASFDAVKAIADVLQRGFIPLEVGGRFITPTEPDAEGRNGVIYYRLAKMPLKTLETRVRAARKKWHK